MRRTLTAMGALAGAAGLALLVAQGPATAQPRDPTATDIIDALRPKPGQAQPATRGIRPVSPQAAPAPTTPTAPASAPSSGDLRPVAPSTPSMPTPVQQAAPVPVAPTMPAAEAPSISLNVLFAVNSADLTPQARRVLDELGRALTSADLSPYRFRIEGHTDTTGNAGYNLALSERRAAAVRDYLTQRFGISSTRLDTVGLGQTQLAVPTADNVNEPRNRRVHIVNIGS